MRLSMGILADKVPVNLNGEYISITTGLGISIYPDDRLKDELLMKKVGPAIYKARELGRNKAVLLGASSRAYERTAGFL
jgi:GGDEF domain-containing protein